MSLKNKVFITLGLLFLCASVGDIMYLKHKNTQLQNQHAQIDLAANLAIGRAHTVIANAESEKKLLSDQIQQDIRDKQALLDSYSILEAKYNSKGSGSLVVREVPGATKEVYVNVEGKPVQITTMPFQFDDFRLHVNGDAITKTFNYTLNQNFEVQLADTKLKSGAHNHYAELYELDSGGKRINKLELTKFEVTESDNNIRPQLKWFDWHLDLDVNYDVHRNFSHSIAGELGLSMASYGKPSVLTWRFIRGSIGLDKTDIYIGFSPVQYNLGDPLPLFSNLWITPTVGYGLDTKTYLLGLGISVIL